MQNYKQNKYKKFFKMKFKYGSHFKKILEQKKYGYKFVPVHGILNINFSFNNTIGVLTDLSGKAELVVSAGTLKFKNSKKSSKYSMEMVVKELTFRAKNLGYKRIFLHLSGIGQGKVKCLRLINKAKLNVLLIADFTSLPHNGCRPSKIRRL
jgi:small subunit ribosomal protein S11